MLKKMLLLLVLTLLFGFEPVHFQIEGIGGMVAVPQNDGDHPIVFIVGDQKNELLETLSQEDLLAVWLAPDAKTTSVTFERFRQGFNRWLQGEAPELGQNLYGKGSFSRTAFIGIGEACDDVLEIVRRQHNTQMEVSEVMLLAPTRSREATMEPLPDVPLAIALPQTLLEENIVALTYFQKMRQDGLRQADASIYFVQAGNGFSQFQKDFVASRLAERFEDAPPKVGLDASRLAPDSLFQMGVKSALILEGDEPILDPVRFANPLGNSFGKNHLQNLEMDHFRGLTDMYQLRAEAGSSLVMAFDQALDISNREAISLYFNYANDHNTPLKFSLELEDMDGQWEAFAFESQYPFNFGSGGLIPFYQERVLLDSLQLVDLTSITSMTLRFEEGIKGQFSIGDISLSGYKDAPCGEY